MSQPENARERPAAGERTGQIGAVQQEWKAIAAVERVTMRRVEARVPLRKPLIGPEQIAVAGADEGCLRRRVLAQAVGIVGLEPQTRGDPVDPFDLHSVVPALGGVGDDEVGGVARVGPPLIGSRHAEADLVVRDRHRLRARRVDRDAGKAGARAVHIGGDPIDRASPQIGEARGRRVVRVIDDQHRTVGW